MAQVRVPLAIIGGGNMAQSIVRGAIDAGVLGAPAVAVAEPEPAKRDIFRAWGVRAVKTAEELLSWLRDLERRGGPGQLLVAVKPQSLQAVGKQYRPLLIGQRRVIVSILAGTPTGLVQRELGGKIAVVRVMTNTPAQVRRAVTAVSVGAGAQEGDEAVALEVFSALGRVVPIEEHLMDAFTAVAGSGPAYVFYLTEAITRAAVAVGFDPHTAGLLARWTVSGAGALLDSRGEPPEVLRAAVTSKGGTTAAAVAVLDERAVMESFVKAVVAARDRGLELGRP